MKNRKMGRREAMGAIGVAGAAVALGCGDSPTSATPTNNVPSTTTPPTSTNAACAVTPTETVGPYPSLVDLVRSDIREGKVGTTLTLTVKVVNANSACAAVANANVEIWQWTRPATTHNTERRPRRRTCAGSRPPTPTARSRSPRSTRAGTRGEPPTSTSR